MRDIYGCLWTDGELRPDHMTPHDILLWSYAILYWTTDPWRRGQYHASKRWAKNAQWRSAISQKNGALSCTPSKDWKLAYIRSVIFGWTRHVAGLINKSTHCCNFWIGAFSNAEACMCYNQCLIGHWSGPERGRENLLKDTSWNLI
jgi:hypothetical protein